MEVWPLSCPFTQEDRQNRRRFTALIKAPSAAGNRPWMTSSTCPHTDDLIYKVCRMLGKKKRHTFTVLHRMCSVKIPTTCFDSQLSLSCLLSNYFSPLFLKKQPFKDTVQCVNTQERELNQLIVCFYFMSNKAKDFFLHFLIKLDFQ